MCYVGLEMSGLAQAVGTNEIFILVNEAQEPATLTLERVPRNQKSHHKFSLIFIFPY